MSDPCPLKTATRPLSDGLDRGVHEVSGVQRKLALRTTVIAANQCTNREGYQRLSMSQKPRKMENSRLSGANGSLLGRVTEESSG
jgi:hypothetical protein